jgi:chemotaxis protein CheC
MKDEMDILREVGSIAAGHGSIALSEILGTKIDVEMPSLDIVPISQISQKIPANNIVISVACNILSGIKGEIVFVLEEKSAFKLVDLCYRVHPDDKKGSIFTEMGLSVIKEVGNVIISSYVGALSMILKTIVIPSIPTLVSGSIQQSLNMVVAPYSKEASVLFAEAVFVEPNARINGSFYLILTDEAMLYIQQACKKLLESLD